jgi:hypothetical protein
MVMLRNLLSIVALCACLTAPLAATAQAAANTPPPCQEAQQKQLDFWVGEWDLTWPGTKAGEVAHGANSVKRILDGCVVEENFSGESAIHLRGRSFSLFDASAGAWKQTWVDNEDGYLDFIGGVKDGTMSFWREAKRRDGTPAIQRMIWRNVTADSFDWSWESSSDGGKTWQVMWPIHYQRRK